MPLCAATTARPNVIIPVRRRGAYETARRFRDFNNRDLGTRNKGRRAKSNLVVLANAARWNRNVIERARRFALPVPEPTMTFADFPHFVRVIFGETIVFPMNSARNRLTPVRRHDTDTSHEIAARHDEILSTWRVTDRVRLCRSEQKRITPLRAKTTTVRLVVSHWCESGLMRTRVNAARFQGPFKESHSVWTRFWQPVIGSILYVSDYSLILVKYA